MQISLIAFNFNRRISETFRVIKYTSFFGVELQFRGIQEYIFYLTFLIIPKPFSFNELFISFENIIIVFK